MVQRNLHRPVSTRQLPVTQKISIARRRPAPAAPLAERTEEPKGNEPSAIERSAVLGEASGDVFEPRLTEGAFGGDQARTSDAHDMHTAELEYAWVFHGQEVKNPVCGNFRHLIHVK